jgi:hypothetical protein
MHPLAQYSTRVLACFLATGTFQFSMAQSTASETSVSAKPSIHIIHMGGNDCPPCIAWRATDYLKLKDSSIFKSVNYTYVTKSIQSQLPSSFFLPDDVKPHKDKLDIASGGNRGSPQAAVLVNGEVYDYYFGTRSAVQIEKMIQSIQNTTPYPEKRCTRRLKGWSCAENG